MQPRKNATRAQLEADTILASQFTTDPLLPPDFGVVIPPEEAKLVVQVYIDNGVVFEYDVTGAHKAREHAFAITATGYRHNDGKGEFEHYPAHRIAKVKVKGLIPTKYPDRVSGT